MPDKISVIGNDTLTAVILAMKLIAKTVRLDIYSEARRVLGPEWNGELMERSHSALEEKVLVRGNSIRVGTQGFSVRAAASAKKLSGGLQPSTQWTGVELGASKGKPFRQRNRQGYVVFPAARSIGKRLVELWVQLIVKTMHDSFEGKL